METLNCTAPPGVYLATASWLSYGSQIPIGLFNSTQALGILNTTTVIKALNSGSVASILPMVIISRGNGTLTGYLMGINALNYSEIVELVNEASG